MLRTATNLGLFLVLAALVATAHAEKRVALVIGNSAYRSAAPLPNPLNDAKAVAETFKAARFDTVTLRTDVTSSELRRAVSDFSDVASDSDIAIIYFAGHG